MLTESVALACCGAVPGLVLAVAGTRAIAHLDAFDIPLLASVRLDGDALVFTLLAAVLTGVLFGLLPALQVRSFAAQSGSISHVLKDGSHGRAPDAYLGPPRVGGFRDRVCLHLTGGAGLLMRSFLGVMDVNPGFQPEGVAALRVNPSFRFSGLAQQNSYIDAVLQRTRAVPGIQAASLAEFLPLGGSARAGLRQGTDLPKGPPSRGLRLGSERRILRVPRIRLQAGRAFTERDRASSEPVVIVNETLARTLWPAGKRSGSS